MALHGGVVRDPGRADAEVPLEAWGSGTQPSNARRREGVVYREAGPWSSTVLALLRHLDQAGFAGAPQVIGSGLTPDGREMVSYVPGASPQPHAWSEDAVAGVGTLLASLHAAAATFVPPPDASWKPWFGRELPASQWVIGHGDTGPWNIVARDGRPVALIDFEFAGPVGAVWDHLARPQRVVDAHPPGVPPEGDQLTRPAFRQIRAAGSQQGEHALIAAMRWHPAGSRVG